jgi:hypothetical protein
MPSPIRFDVYRSDRHGPALAADGWPDVTRARAARARRLSYARAVKVDRAIAAAAGAVAVGAELPRRAGRRGDRI